MNKKTIITFLLLIVIASGASFAIGRSQSKNTSEQAKSKCDSKTSVFDEEKNSCFKDKGDLVLKIEEAQTDETVKYQEYLESSKAMEPILDDMNSDYAFPYDIPVIFKNCDEANAYYDSDTKTITYCYELMQDVDGIYASLGDEGQDLEDSIFNNTIATFFHELGHGFIDIYSLPITGRDEDVADQISTYILINSYEGGASTVLTAADEYAVNAEKNPPEADSFADTHTLDQARFFNLVCWVYGSNEEEFKDLPEETNLPADRAERCADEYKKIDSSVSYLLKGYSYS